MEPSRESRAPRVFALFSDSIVFRIFRLWRIGTSDINSTPPATTASHWPAAIKPAARKQINNQQLSCLWCRMLKFYSISICSCMLCDHWLFRVMCCIQYPLSSQNVRSVPVVIAWLEEIHAIVTVWAGVLSENPAPSAAYQKTIKI